MQERSAVNFLLSCFDEALSCVMRWQVKEDMDYYLMTYKRLRAHRENMARKGPFEAYLMLMMPCSLNTTDHNPLKSRCTLITNIISFLVGKLLRSCEI